MGFQDMYPVFCIKRQIGGLVHFGKIQARFGKGQLFFWFSPPVVSKGFQGNQSYRKESGKSFAFRTWGRKYRFCFKG